MKKISLYKAPVLFALAFCTLVCAYQTTAQTAVDPQIAVCSSASIQTMCGNDPNVINPTSINVGFIGNHTAVSPLLIIVGVPNSGGDPTISLPAGVNPIVLGTYYGALTTGTLAGAPDGTLSSGSPAAPNNNAYFAVGGASMAAGGGSSESWTNWSTYDTAHGVTVGTSFNLYVFGIDCALGSVGCKSPINIDFTGIAPGSFVVAYNCATAGSTCTGGDVGSTPFTNAGVSFPGGSPPPPIPEPASMLLMGTGLVAFGGMLRRRKSEKSVVA
jgi:hypothetical protein